MSLAQRIIKYLALAFAILLIYGIISFLLGLVLSLGNGLNVNNSNNLTEETEMVFNMENDYIDTLNIDLVATTLDFKYGNNFSCETNNKNISCGFEDTKFIVKENKNNLLTSDESELVVTVPDKEYNSIIFDTGAGKITVDTMKTQKLDFDLGAGIITINDLNAFNSAKINTGAGKTLIQNGNISNLDLDMGVGEVIVNTILTGNNKLDAGIGSLKINLMDSLNNYTFNISKGLGAITLNGSQSSDNQIIGTGNNTISVEGGIGSINIVTK